MSLPQVSAPRGTNAWSLSQQQPVMQAVCCRAIRGLSNYMFHEATRMAKVALHNLPSEPCCALTGQLWLAAIPLQPLLTMGPMQESQTSAGDKHDG